MEKIINSYETLFVIDPDLTEEATKALVEKFSKLITDNNGEISEVNEWGKRKLAYLINDKSEGYYVLMYVKAPSEMPKELEGNFQINDKILRSLVIRYEGELPAKREPIKPREVAAPVAEPVVEAPAAVVVDDEKPESEAE